MKSNFNQHILDGQTYLFYLFDNRHIKHCDYERFVQTKEHEWKKNYPALMHICDIHGIDIYPYLYTLDRLHETEVISFSKFYSIYLRKTEMIPQDEREYHHALYFASMSIENLVAFIATMQYFFL
jgi:hypothetical protein